MSEQASTPLSTASTSTPPAVPDAPRRVRKDYWNGQKLSLWERLYVPEIVHGLLITGRVFAGNMAKWLTGRKGAVTAYYPEEQRPDYSPINRGRHVLTQRPDGSLQCVSCNMCATICPAYCIEIEAGSNPADRAHPKSPTRFEIDYSRCIFCGFCVEVCPEDAIRMAPETPRLPGFDRTKMWGTMDLLAHWKPMADPKKPYPPAPGPEARPVPRRAPGVRDPGERP